MAGITKSRKAIAPYNPGTTEDIYLFSHCDHSEPADGRLIGGSLSLVGIASGTGAALTGGVLTENRFGVIQVRNGSSAGSLAGFQYELDSALRFGDFDIRCGVVLKVNDIPSATEDYHLTFGLGNNIGTFATEGAIWFADKDLSLTNWYAYTGGSGGFASEDTGKTVNSSAFEALEIYVPNDLSKVEYWHNGSLAFTEDTAANIPQANTKINFNLTARNISTSGTNDIEVDFIYLKLTPKAAIGSFGLV